MLRANTSFFAGDRFVSLGELVASNDPVVAGREALFDRVDSAPVVEEATAVPGVKRATKRVAKKTAGE